MSKMRCKQFELEHVPENFSRKADTLALLTASGFLSANGRRSGCEGGNGLGTSLMVGCWSDLSS